MKRALPVPIRVECYAGYRGEETPRAFTRGGKRYQVVEIVERWYEEQAEAGLGRRLWFLVKLEDERLVRMYRDERLDSWFLDV